MLYFGRKQTAGVPVTHETAMAYTAVWRAVNLISQSVAMMPWTVMQRDSSRQSETLWTHPAYSLLDLQPNDEIDALTWRQTVLAWALTWGNGYAEIDRDLANRPGALWQLEPTRVNPDRTQNGRLVYDISNGTAANTVLDPSQMFHLRGLGFNGLQGYSVIAYAAKAIGLGLATEKFGSNFFANGAHSNIVIQHPEQLSDTALKHLQDSLQQKYGGDSSHTPMVLEEGMTSTQITIPPDDAQFLETRKFQVAEIARIYGVPLHKLHEMDKSSFNNIEQQNIEFVSDALMIWVKRFELEANIKLISPAARGRTYTKLNVNALLRGDTKTRGEWYKMMTNIGAMSINEVRALEDENSIGSDGDKYMVQMNLTTVDKVGQEQTSNAPQNAPPFETDEEEGGEGTEPDMELAAARTILVENFARIISRCDGRAKEALKNYDGDRDGLIRYLDNFKEDQRAYMRKQLETPTKAFKLNINLDRYIDQQIDDQVTSVLASFDTGTELFHVEPMIMVSQMMEYAQP